MLQMFGPNLIIGTTMNSLHLVSLGDDSDKLPLNGAVIDAAPVTQVNSVYFSHTVSVNKNPLSSFSSINCPDFAAKFVICRGEKVKQNFTKYSSHDDRFCGKIAAKRRDISPRNFFFLLLFLCEIDCSLIAFLAQNQDFFVFLYADF